MRAIIATLAIALCGFSPASFELLIGAGGTAGVDTYWLVGSVVELEPHHLMISYSRGRNHGCDHDVWVAESFNNGRTFEYHRKVPVAAAPDVSERGPVLSVLPSGRIILNWNATQCSGTLREIRWSHSDDGGASFGPYSVPIDNGTNWTSSGGSHVVVRGGKCRFTHGTRDSGDQCKNIYFDSAPLDAAGNCEMSAWSLALIQRDCPHRNNHYGYAWEEPNIVLDPHGLLGDELYVWFRNDLIGQPYPTPEQPDYGAYLKKSPDNGETWPTPPVRMFDSINRNVPIVLATGEMVVSTRDYPSLRPVLWIAPPPFTAWNENEHLDPAGNAQGHGALVELGPGAFGSLTGQEFPNSASSSKMWFQTFGAHSLRGPPP